MIDMTCIVCPRGCMLHIETASDGSFSVSGNSCKRGEAFAISEMTEPMRTVCSTVRTSFADVPVIPVRVSAEIPKSRIFDVMNEINKVTVTKEISRGDAVIKNVLGLGADVIATSDVLKK